MISTAKKFLFIHVPKTGGNSIQCSLGRYGDDAIVATAPHHDGIERFELRHPDLPTEKHSTLSDYRSLLDHQTFGELFRFAVLRNPWERMVSLFFSPHRGISRWDRDSFLAVIEDALPTRHYICAAPHTSQLDGDLDHLLRFEKLSVDFRLACERIGIAPPALPVRNRSAHRHYSTYYDTELLEFVGEKFAEEIELGGYGFESG